MNKLKRIRQEANKDALIHFYKKLAGAYGKNQQLFFSTKV